MVMAAFSDCCHSRAFLRFLKELSEPIIHSPLVQPAFLGQLFYLINHFGQGCGEDRVDNYDAHSYGF